MDCMPPIGTGYTTHASANMLLSSAPFIGRQKLYRTSPVVVGQIGGLMSRQKSGLLLILIGIVLQVVGRLLGSQIKTAPNLILSGLAALIMFSSVVVIVFGLYRLLTSRSG